MTCVAGRPLRQVALGDGAPAVVLEAGRNNTSDSWSQVMPLLAAQVRVVAYDRAGLGGSPPAGDEPVVERQLGDLTSVITGLEAGPCVLAGQSWGGILVQLLAYRRPELVAGLVLVDPAVEQMASPVLLPLRWALRTALPRHVDELSSTDTDTAMRALRKLRATRPLTDVPVVVLSADLGRPRWARRYFTSLQAQLAAGNPRGRHAVVSGAGHDIPEELPGIVADAILEVVTQARAARR